MSDQITSPALPVVPSIEYIAKPRDSRCKYWCKIVRAGDALPLPSAVTGASDIPGPYLRKGDDVEIFPGDFVLSGEEVSHRVKRGWAYQMFRLDSGKIAICAFGSLVKDAVRRAGRKDLLGGSGDVAAMVRTIHARRAGIWPIKAAPAPEAPPSCASTRGLVCDCPGVVCLAGAG